MKFSTNWPLQAGSQTDLRGQVHDLNRFENTLPNSDYNSVHQDEEKHVTLTRPSPYNINTNSDRPIHGPKSKLRSVFWPALAITVPIALLSATLLALVFAYQVHSQPSIFNIGSSSNQQGKNYVLVNFSATRLVFAASFLSTVAPLLASFIMILYSLIVSANMRRASSNLHFDSLPTPYQLSVLVGLCLASVQQLRAYITYATSRKRRMALPPVLNRAAGVFFLCILLATGVFISDTALHYYTSTINFDRISKPLFATEQSGYGLDSLCLNLNRVQDNYGFPCSLPVNSIDPNWIVHQNEIHRLQSNTSTTSQLRIAEAPNLGANLAVMIPNPAGMNPGHDYRASTVGISTQCKLIPPTVCKMHAFGDENPQNPNVYTQFNCTPSFYGAIGMPPNISSVDGLKSIDPNLPPLGWKYSPNLQTGFFSDDKLSQVWNPEGWNATTDQPDDVGIIPDSQLINPMYLGLAIRVANSSFPPTSSISSDTSNIFRSQRGDYLDMILSCSITSYSVNYTWFQSSLHNITAVPHTNGSILEIYHGSQIYNSVSGAGADLQVNLADSAITGLTASDFANTWSNLYSVKVLSTIGAFLSPRTNIEEQTRETLLVARVPKPALASLITCSLIYTVLGITLTIAAWRATGGPEVKLVADQLSLAGLTAMAFGEKQRNTTDGAGWMDGSRSATLTPGSAISSEREKMSAMSGGLARGEGEDYFTRMPLRTKRDERETRRVRISGSDFRVWG